MFLSLSAAPTPAAGQLRHEMFPYKELQNEVQVGQVGFANLPHFRIRVPRSLGLRHQGFEEGEQADFILGEGDITEQEGVCKQLQARVPLSLFHS